MKIDNEIISRLIRAIKNEDDPKLLFKLEMSDIQLASSLNTQRELNDQRNELIGQREFLTQQRDELAQQRDELAQQRDELAQQRDALANQRDELTRQRDELANQRDELTRQRDELAQQRDEIIREKTKIDTKATNDLAEKDKQYNEIVIQLMSLSEKLINYERLAKFEGDHDANLSKSNLSNKSHEVISLRKLYLDLMQAVLTGTIYDDQPQNVFGKNQFDSSVRNRGLDWPEKAFSMVGSARIQNFRNLIELAIIEDLPGDIVETGVWRGGASILAKAVLTAYGCSDKKVILCDSFAGLPEPDATQYPKDEGSNFHEFPQLAVSLEQVQENFKKFGLLDDQVIFVKGWFKDTMPHIKVENIAILRLDGDMYESTLTPLKYLFDRVVPGGWIIIDDYEWIPACKAAVHDFLDERKLNFNIQKIDGVGVYFQKNWEK